MALKSAHSNLPMENTTFKGHLLLCKTCFDLTKPKFTMICEWLMVSDLREKDLRISKKNWQNYSEFHK